MLSFLGTIHVKTKYITFVMQERANTKSLQVPCSPLNFILNATRPGKRVLPFTSRERMSASMTVEAAIALPLFVFLAIALMMPMKWLDTQRKMQTVIERRCENLSQYAYLAETMIEELGMDGEDIVLEETYSEQVPFFRSLSGGVTMRVAAKRRCWYGLKGKLKVEGNGEAESDDSEEMVYVGKTMTRYHTYQNCHYISNNFQEVSLADAMNLRDPDGSRLKACAKCAAGELAENRTVYVTPSGEHYHSTSACSAMVFYVRKVPLAEVEYLGECSSCRRRESEG